MYKIGKIDVKRCGDNKLELKIGSEKAEVFTEDLAVLIASELPKERAHELLSDMEETMITKGKARIVVEAKKDIKVGEQVCFTIDISKYLDSKGIVQGIRATPSGIIF